MNVFIIPESQVIKSNKEEDERKAQPFKIIDVDGVWIVTGTYSECQEFLEKSLNNKYLIQKRVKKWKIVENKEEEKNEVMS